MLPKHEFLKKYHISEDEFDKNNLDWNTLLLISNDYDKHKKKLKPIIDKLSNKLGDFEKVHSVRKRIKDTEHLIEKIIRKSISKKILINVDNYKKEISDLLGLRILHLFKEDWKEIHDEIIKEWDTLEEPTANHRRGDDISIFEERNCKIKEHPFGYRSVHYIIKESGFIAEIQVRTVFEEAWSEIDHEIRYPYDINNAILVGYLSIFNTLSGNADEMGTFIRFLKESMDLKNDQLRNQESIINNLKKEIQTTEMQEDRKATMIFELESISKQNRKRNDLLDINNLKKYMPQLCSSTIELGRFKQLNENINNVNFTEQLQEKIISLNNETCNNMLSKKKHKYGLIEKILKIMKK